MLILEWLLLAGTVTLFLIGCFAGYVEGDADYKDSCSPVKDRKTKKCNK